VVADADLRMPVLGGVAWLAVLAVLAGPTWLAPSALGGLLVGVGAALARRRLVAGTAAVLLVAGAAAGTAVLHEQRLTAGPVAWLAGEHAAADVIARVTSDPRAVRGRYGEERVRLRVTVLRVTGRGRTWHAGTPVVVLGGREWARVPIGATVGTTGRLAPADGDAAALLLAQDEPSVTSRPGWWWGGAERVRESLRASVAHRPEHQRALVPALVVGDDQRLDPGLAEDFRATGLTHLLAVSGTNLTLLVGFLLVVARWAGLRGRWLILVGALGIVGFVLLARTEPSVVRAATMGSVALLGLGRNGLQRGTRSLGVAVVVLLLVDPWLALSAGFALSVLATTGILLLAPPWRDAMHRWLPRWVAEAVAVPATAQLACTPVVAAISGQVSLVAVGANLLAAPAVGPATVLGLAGGLAGLVWPAAGRTVGTLAGWSVAWIVAVAEAGARLPAAAVDWGTGPTALLVLTVGCLVLALAGPPVLGRPLGGLGASLLLVVGTLVGPPRPGWPPEGWLLVACDVGQGDALVLRAGPGSAVVVDAGPDSRGVDRCLDALDVREVPVVAVTHLHADHVDGLPGVVAGRPVGRLLLAEHPAVGPTGTAAALGVPEVPVRRLAYGQVVRAGSVTLQVLGPPPGRFLGEDALNDASLVLLAEVEGTRLLLTGDVEPPAQAALRGSFPGLEVDVLKVPHHGSRHQDLGWLAGLGARVAVVSVGEDNDYGHPSPDVLGPLSTGGVLVARTDTDGDVAVLVRDGELRVRTAR
jgi:competence protein ComEC